MIISQFVKNRIHDAQSFYSDPKFCKNTHMKNIQRTWQKLVYYSGIISFIAAVACLIILYFWQGDLGWKHVYTASLAASSFFFASMGVVLVTIGTSDLPSLKVKNTKP